MTLVRIDSISGVTYPVDVYVADVYGNNRTFLANISSGPVPPELSYTTLPPLFNNAPAVMIIVIDANNCEKFEIVDCTLQETATPTVTPSQTLTPTPTLTPGLSPTPTSTPTETPTTTPTPSVTPTFTVTPSVTSTQIPTPTPSITNTSTSSPTPTPTPTSTLQVTPTPTPTVTETSTPTPTETLTPTVTTTITPTETSTPTPTPTVTTTITPTITVTPTFTPTPTLTPAVITFAYLIIDVNTSGQTQPLSNYMTSQGSPWGGFNVGNPLGQLDDNPFDGTPTNATSQQNGMPNSPNINTNINGDVIVSIGFLDDDVVASSISAPALYTLIGAADYGTPGANNGATVMAAFRQQPTAGGANPGAFVGAGSDSWRASTIALRPIAGTIPQIQYVGQTQSTTNTITLPTGLQEGDMVIIASASDSTPQPVPIGYTDGNGGQTPNNGVQYRWAWKYMGITPDTVATGLSNNSVHIAFAFRNVYGYSVAKQRFNDRFNAYIRYSGWGGNQPPIFTAPISNISRGVDAFGVDIIAGRFQTTEVSGNTLPFVNGQSPLAWYTWFVPTGATPGQAYTAISMFRNPITPAPIPATQNFYTRVVHYTGSTNIPQGYYRIYTSYSNAGLSPRLNNQNLYFRGGDIRINV